MIRTSWRPLGRAAALAAALALLLIGVAAPAHAEAPEKHCVILLGDDADLVVCAETPDAAIQRFTAETGLTVTQSADVVGPSVVYSIAQLFAASGYAGTSYLITRATACNGVTLSSLPDLGAIGLNDAVSSFLTFSTCTVRLFADINYGGSTLGYTTSQSSLPTFNDVASSARAR